MVLRTAPYGPASLRIDPDRETSRIAASLSDMLTRTRRRGLVIALSGGIDSSVVAALCVAAVGPDRVFGLHLPERESSPESLELSRQLADSLGIDSQTEEITELLQAAGCYRRRDDAIRLVCPEYGTGWRSKIVLPGAADSAALPVYSVVVSSPVGIQTKHRLTREAYLGVVAATNFKQRVRAMLAYHHADRLHYLVAGTPNRLEYDQGFFVKLGDGAADVKPIAHLYKSQVYALAEHLNVPESIRSRPSTTDTYSLPQSQEEFYFSLPHERMDLCLFGKNHAVPVPEIAAATGLTHEQVDRVFHDIDAKRRATRHLHAPAALVEEVPEVGGW